MEEMSNLANSAEEMTYRNPGFLVFTVADDGNASLRQRSRLNRSRRQLVLGGEALSDTLYERRRCGKFVDPTTVERSRNRLRDEVWYRKLDREYAACRERTYQR